MGNGSILIYGIIAFGLELVCRNASLPRVNYFPKMLIFGANSDEEAIAGHKT